MKTLEFDASLNPDKTLTVPPEVADKLPAGSSVRVLLVIADGNEDDVWQRLTAEQFFQGYAESDAIYDELSGR